MKKDRILIIEADSYHQRLLRAQLLALDFEVHVAGRGEDGIVAAAKVEPDLIFLALSLPGIDGIEACRRLREWTRTPVIALREPDQEGQAVDVLDAGADDCVSKPFRMAELLARMRAVLRRARDWASPAASCTSVSLRNLTVDFVCRRVSLDGQALHLTPTEYELLRVLALHPGRVLTHRELLTQVWGPASACDTQYLHVFISQLRRKLEPDPDSPRHIHTEVGVGYSLAESA